LFDIVAAGILCLAGIPLLFVLFLITALAFNGRPFFLQERAGYRGKIFRVIKFTTMTAQKDADGNLLPDHQRLTPVGKFFRRTSLDELPQLFNILKGEMSIVGPRPLLPEYLPLYSPEQQQRHNIKPGLTGWAQVNGRTALSWQQKFELDLWYVQHISFKTDLIIIGMTIKHYFNPGEIKRVDQINEKFTGKNP